MYGGKRQKTIIDFKCEPKRGNNAAPTWKHYDPKDGELKLTWLTPLACSAENDGDGDGGGPQRGDKPAGETDPSRSGGWGFFSWFFFL